MAPPLLHSSSPDDLEVRSPASPKLLAAAKPFPTKAQRQDWGEERLSVVCTPWRRVTSIGRENLVAVAPILYAVTRPPEANSK